MFDRPVLGIDPSVLDNKSAGDKTTETADDWMTEAGKIISEDVVLL